MDEILSYRESESVEQPGLAGKLLRRPLNLPRFHWERKSSADRMANQSEWGPAIFAIAGISITATALLGSLYRPVYELTVDGESLGRVESVQAVEQAVKRVEHRASNILGEPYTLDRTLNYQFGLALRDDVIPVSQVETYLFDGIGDFMKSSVLTLNGKMLGATDDEAALTAMLDSLKAPYVNENTVSAEFVQPLVVTKEYTPTSQLRDLDVMRTELSGNRMEQVDYTVQAGDTFSGIANGHDLKVSQLEALNPGVEIESLMVGDILTISQAVPLLSIRTVDHVTYDGPVAFQVEEVPDDSMYEGDTVVLTEGVDGMATYNADVTYLDGVEQERDVNSMQVYQEPVTAVVAVGTKERPRTMATGHFQWPLSGRITSGYGSRYIFGSYSFHSGLDIAAPYGTPIMAADGGRVTWAGTGTGSFWSYGKYVVINHENGLQTIYGHCSSLDVEAGDRVYKGQVIARVGSTGRSTGNHCHFQVKLNGTTVDPNDYLP